MEINPFTDEFFMKEALKEASKASQLDEVPVGAVVVCENQIIARAHNYTQTLNDVTAHAEMLAFTSAFDFLGGKYLDDCTLYVTLEPCIITELDVITREPVDVFVYYMKNSDKIFHFQYMEVDELTRTTGLGQ